MKKEIKIVQEQNSEGDRCVYSIYCTDTDTLIWQGYDSLPADIVFQCFPYIKEHKD